MAVGEPQYWTTLARTETLISHLQAFLAGSETHESLQAWARALWTEQASPTHVLRKTCGTRIADGGGGVAAVATHLHHKSLTTASRYIDRRGASSRALNALETSWRRGSEQS